MKTRLQLLTLNYFILANDKKNSTLVPSGLFVLCYFLVLGDKLKKTERRLQMQMKSVCGLLDTFIGLTRVSCFYLFI